MKEHVQKHKNVTKINVLSKIYEDAANIELKNLNERDIAKYITAAQKK